MHQMRHGAAEIDSRVICDKILKQAPSASDLETFPVLQVEEFDEVRHIPIGKMLFGGLEIGVACRFEGALIERTGSGFDPVSHGELPASRSECLSHRDV